MQSRKLKIGVARFPYAGNGSTESEHPAVGDWIGATVPKIKADDRCEDEIWRFKMADTPIPMVRNLALRRARDAGVDVLVMIDSDQIPDIDSGHQLLAKPFWDTSFDFLWQHFDKGPCCIGAPYCGPVPPPHVGGTSNIYVFHWRINQNEPENQVFDLSQFTREEAAQRLGIELVGALPTGLYMIDMRTVDVVPPPWFSYEWTDAFESEKASTEDVFFTRNASLLGVPQYCNWDAWAGHAKPWIVGKPAIIGANEVGETLRTAWESGLRSDRYTLGGAEANLTQERLDAARSAPGGNGQQAASPFDGSMPLCREPKIMRSDLAKFEVIQRKYSKDLVEHSHDGSWSGNTMDPELDRLMSLVASLAAERDRPLKILEIGSWAGASACAMLAGLGPQGGHLWCVDTWKGAPGDLCEANAKLYGSENVRAIFRENIEAYASDTVGIAALEMTSVEAAKQTDLPEKFDLIFIDGDHSAEGIATDLRLWTPRVDGIACGHDYDSMFPDVVQAVRPLKPSVDHTLWWVQWPGVVKVADATKITQDRRGNLQAEIGRDETVEDAKRRMPPPEFEGQQLTIKDSYQPYVNPAGPWLSEEDKGDPA